MRGKNKQRERRRVQAVAGEKSRVRGSTTLSPCILQIVRKLLAKEQRQVEKLKVKAMFVSLFCVFLDDC